MLKGRVKEFTKILDRLIYIYITLNRTQERLYFFPLNSMIPVVNVNKLYLKQ